ncbi:hypothetical protein FA048_15840 [Pedobacter polaris]|uniref:Thoeris protein ThsA Macro domain-containing protein n=1 Tax=Pedobacter polaris TaxID=2571273 RepID=A0A4U1CHA0_9SPHI|nr:macro domain-containing protein [Pedobacter polaris]TKC06675.1 hypothetical protein FA048_15840 [Pedobacter polaris]
MKVKLFEKNIRNRFWKIFSIISGIISFAFLFIDIPTNIKEYLAYIGVLVLIILVVIYFLIWLYANTLRNIDVDIDGSNVNIKCGDIFEQDGLKVITFNEYFDTIVDDKIISNSSLNGIFIKKFFQNNVNDLDEFIRSNSVNEDITELDVVRHLGGKNVKYKLSTSLVYETFVLTAFTRFDNQNRAVLTMPEYIEFLINFWDRINRVYAQRTVSVPVFGSGITRIKEHKNISDEELLKIMLWTFKLSEMKFKHPARLSIIIHEDKIGQIDLFNLKSIELSI